jgi:REP element-mobilizing transposase RayT
MPPPQPLQFGRYYHIYNRGVNRESLFKEEKNYTYFLRLYARYIEPVAATFAYCLLNNHFHFLLWIKTDQTGPISEIGPVSPKSLNPSRQFNNLFIAYAKAINKTYQRTGPLFESPFRRIPIENDSYFIHLITYIHRNPQNHGFVEDFRDWPYSSYRAIVSDNPTFIRKKMVLEWFGARSNFEEAHLAEGDDNTFQALVDQDWL